MNCFALGNVLDDFRCGCEPVARRVLVVALSTTVVPVDASFEHLRDEAPVFPTHQELRLARHGAADCMTDVLH